MLRKLNLSVSATYLRRSLATHVGSQSSQAAAALPTRHDWSRQEIQNIYDTPLLELVFQAASVHRKHHDPSKIQLCTLMNIKSTLSNLPHMRDIELIVSLAGGCSEDCSYSRAYIHADILLTEAFA